MQKKNFYIIGGLIFLFAVTFLSAPYLIKKEIDKRLARLEEKWNGIVDYDKLEVDGLTVRFHKLYLSGNDTLSDPLFAAKNLTIRFSLWHLLTKNPLPEYVLLDTAYLNIYNKKDGRWNFSSLTADTIPHPESVGYVALLGKLYWLLDQPFENNIPQMNVRNLNIDFSFGGDHFSLARIFMLSNQDSLKLAAVDKNGFLVSLNGIFNSDSLIFSQNNPVRLDLPLPGNDNLTIGSDSGRCVIRKNSKLQFTINLDLNKFEIRTSGIADQTVEIPHLMQNVHLLFSNDHQSVSITNRVKITEMELLNRITFTETDELPAIDMNLSIPPIDAGMFHRSLPAPLLGELKDLWYSGKLGYNLHFKIDFNQIDSLVLRGEILKDKFRVINSGVSFSKLDSEFYQPVYDGLEISREIFIGQSNKNFVRFTDLPNHLVQAVITSEDGGFFKHRGFNEDAIRESLIENIKEKRFKRGASTISMQFVKNVYLNRQKSLSRKFQELFITWMLELQQPVTKERMFEIYINMIEFGPNIYGIGEAAQFYFNKSAKDLTFSESLFLSSIIPSPKKFYRRFDKTGNLTNGSLETMKFVATKMKQFQRIEPMLVDSLSFSNFSVSGKALEWINPITISAPDSLDEE